MVDRGVRLAILVLAHRSPVQLGRLVRRTSVGDVSVIVHVDGKVDVLPFERALEGTGAQLVPERTRVTWGGYSQVRASLALVCAALGQGATHAVLVSGQDYPIRPLTDLLDHLALNRSSQMLDARSIDAEWTEASFRYRRYHFVDQVENARLALPWRVVQRAANKALPTRQAPYGMVVHGGASWWCLSREGLELVDRAGRDPGISKFFRRVAMPDEIFVHTVIMNSPLATKILPAPTYVRFDAEQSGMHPVVWRREHLGELLQSGRYFARKFDSQVDSLILDDLDRELS
jgi:hypothetical protein